MICITHTRFRSLSGSINATNASLTVGSGSYGTNRGTLNLDPTSFLQFSGVQLMLDGAVVAPGYNSLRLGGTTAYVLTTNLTTPSLWQQGGTIYQTTNFVVPTFNQQAGTFYGTLPLAFSTYNMTNAELRGANVTITNFNWLGGSLNSENANSNSVTVLNNLAISGPAAKSLGDYSASGTGRRLINQGTGTWNGVGISGYYGARLVNAGTLTQTTDAGLVFAGGAPTPLFHNLGGTFLKTNATGVSGFSGTSFTNSGTITIAQGGINIGGSFVQTAGSANLGTNFSASADVRIEAGQFNGRGSIAGGFFNNGLSSAGAPLGLIAGASWTNNSTGTIRFEIGGTSAGTNFDQFRLTGPASVNGTADLALANGFVPTPGNTFTCIVSTARSGAFSNLTFSGGYEFTALYTPTTVVFRAENALPTVALTPLTGPTQVVCQPFRLTATASDIGGGITNLAILRDATVIATAGSSPVSVTVESDFPAPLTLVARAIDDQGGISYATQTLTLVTYPLHVLQLGGIRSNAVFKLCMLGQAGSNYTMYASTNVAAPFTNWTALGAMEATNGIWRYFDNGTLTNRALRFYRAQQQ